MTKATLKTTRNANSIETFIKHVQNEGRRSDAQQLLKVFGVATGLQPAMWGDSIIGYGRYEYHYASGRQGEYFMTGFSPRKQHLVLYIMPGYQDLSSLLDRLGRYKTGKSCLYINRLKNVDEAVLIEVITTGIRLLKANYKTFDE